MRKNSSFISTQTVTTQQRVARRLNTMSRIAAQSPKIPGECRGCHMAFFRLESEHLST